MGNLYLVNTSFHTSFHFFIWNKGSSPGFFSSYFCSISPTSLMFLPFLFIDSVCVVHSCVTGYMLPYLNKLIVDIVHSAKVQDLDGHMLYFP